MLIPTSKAGFFAARHGHLFYAELTIDWQATSLTVLDSMRYKLRGASELDLMLISVKQAVTSTAKGTFPRQRQTESCRQSWL